MSEIQEIFAEARKRPCIWQVGLWIHEKGVGAAAIAAVWFWLFAQGIPPAERILLGACLALIVQTIYWLDRGWDHRRREQIPRDVCHFPRGKQLQFFTTFIFIVGVCLLCALSYRSSPEAPFLRLAMWVGACALATGVYYLNRVLSPEWQWGRPFAVTMIFWAGVVGPALAWSGSFPGFAQAGFFVMLWMNARICLLHPSSKNRCRYLLFQILLAWLGIALWLASPGAGVAQQTVSILCIGFLTLLAWSGKSKPSAKKSFLADCALWLPGLILLLLQNRHLPFAGF